MKKAVLLVSFGTSHKDAGENSLLRIYEDLVAAAEGMPVYQAYTSSLIIEKLMQEQIFVCSVEEAVCRAAEDRITCLYVVPTHMLPGNEYHKMVQVLEKHRTEFQDLRIAAPVLSRKEDCEKLVPVLQEMFDFQPAYEYILMGHGTDADANIRYEQMNDAFVRAGLWNVQIASVEAKPDLEDAIRAMQSRKAVRQVMVHPFMVVAGDHAKNDMAGTEDSYVTKLRDAGYQPRAWIKGLGEYPEFRRIYIERLREIMAEENPERQSGS